MRTWCSGCKNNYGCTLILMFIKKNTFNISVLICFYSFVFDF